MLIVKISNLRVSFSIFQWLRWVIIKAYGPLDQMFGYITSLRSATQGKGEFTMEYREHMDVFPQKQQELIDEYKVYESFFFT